MSNSFPEDLYLPLPVASLKTKIHYKDYMVFMGSCFSELIPKKLEPLGFQVSSNPQGILFNPSSILTSLSEAATNNASHFVENSYGEWRSLDFHSSIYAPSTDELARLLSEKQNKSIDLISKASYIFITLGTAWVFRYLKTGKTIANCQKLDASNFSKILLSESEIKSNLEEITNRIKTINPCAQILWTVSPVRHIKNGLNENNISKGRLLSAIYEHVREFTEESYLPIYEILVDCLRDYRYYTSDLIHPSETAENIILDYFIKNYFSVETQSFYRDMQSLTTLKNHKINSTRNQARVEIDKQIENKSQEIKSKYSL